MIDVHPGRPEPPAPAGMPRGEPTPWATGLTVSALTAVIVGIGLFSLSQALVRIGIWAVVLGNLMVATGLTPSMWLARATPTWRWVSYGTAAGIILTWLALLLSLL